MELRDARKSARYTQQQAADFLGVSRVTYAKLEDNPDLVTIEDAKSLSRLFGIPVSDIFFS